jgi:hypothetical protein
MLQEIFKKDTRKMTLKSRHTTEIQGRPCLATQPPLNPPLPTGSARTGKDIILQINWRCKMNDQEILLEIRDRVVRIETRMEDYKEVKDTADAAYNMSCTNKEDVAEIKDGQTWLWRVVVSGFIGGIIAFIFKWGGK